MAISPSSHFFFVCSLRGLRFRALFIAGVLPISLVRAESLPIHPTVPDTMPGAMELDVTPHPQDAQLSDRIFRVGQAVLQIDHPEALGIGLAQLQRTLGPADALQQGGLTAEDPKGTSPETVVCLGLKAWQAARERWPGLPEPPVKPLATEAYVLITQAAADGRPNAILAAGGSVEAEFYALQTLRQISYRRGSESFVRLGTIHDAPTFSIRGNKRFVSWMAGMKANLANQKALFLNYQDEIPIMYRFREYHPISYPPRPPQDLVDVERTVTAFQRLTRTPENQLSPHPVIALLMDDVEVTDAVIDRDRKKYGGYFEAIRAAVAESAETVEAINPSARFFFTPQFYFNHTRDFSEGGKRFRQAGGLPKDVGLFFTGPEVSSLFFPREVVRDYVANLGGSDDTPVMVYDTVYDVDDWNFAVPGFAPDVAEYIAGFVPESGNPVNIGTYYDNLWNPAAYNPDRSESLACREVMGLEKWDMLRQAARQYSRVVQLPGHDVPRAKVLAGARESLTDLVASAAALKKVDASELTGRVDFSVLFERSAKRMFGSFDLSDFLLMNRPLTESEVTQLREKPLAQVLAGIDPAEVGLAVDFSADAFPLLPAQGAGGDLKARYIGPTNTTAGPGGRSAVRFPGFPGTGVEVDFPQPLDAKGGWSAAWWMRDDDPTAQNFVFQVFKDATYEDRNAGAGTNELEKGGSAGRLYAGQGPMTRPGALCDGAWHHVVLTVTADGEQICLVDGVEVFRAPPGSVKETLAGRCVVLGTIPVETSALTTRGILKSWQDLASVFADSATYLENTLKAKEPFYARRLTAPFRSAAVDLAFTEGGRSEGFTPNPRNDGKAFSLEAVHDPEAMLFRISGPLQKDGTFPEVQLYLDPSADRSMAFEFNVPRTAQGEDPARSFVEEGVSGQTARAAFYSRAIEGPQYTDFPIDWSWERTSADGKFTVSIRVPKKPLQKALGGAPLPAAIGIQSWVGVFRWCNNLTWRGRVDPAVFGSLDLAPPHSATQADSVGQKEEVNHL